MLNINIHPGDIFFVDSKKKAPQIVKFLQVAPTVWQWLWRKMRGTNEKVLYYHVGMFHNDLNIIEQQGKVILRDSNKLLSTNNNVLIIRKKNLSVANIEVLLKTAEEDLGEGYDIVNIFGKLFTWLTGIKLFARYMQLPNQDICINRVAYWYRKGLGEKFGAKTHSELTTHTLWKHVIDRPEDFEIIFQGIPREE